MISVLKIDEEKLKCFYEKAGIELNEFSSGVCASSRDEVFGVCLFDLDKKGILIRYIDPVDDIGMADGVLRAALHIAAERCAMDASYAESVSEDLLLKLQFISDKENKKLDIDKLFGGCCCKK
ncbi:MAG: hypothetical protein E7562_06370 [Ruminococcaceae bacterium]|nr:hypothetical protein [Oscillospiraceae bacterium]